MSRFHVVYDKLNRALSEMPFEDLGISEEVKEQVMNASLFMFFFHTFVSYLGNWLMLDLDMWMILLLKSFN